jgi:1-acyl-sn-glycerol-3-phosphate acyltransferase
MWYIRRKLQKNFHEIRVIGTEFPSEGPLLAIGNHISWWDGFFVLHLAQNILNRKLFVMMLEDQLAANPILKYGGAFSVKKGSRDVIESIRYTKELLTKPNSMVLMFPQGKLNSLYSNTFLFEKGLEYLLKNNNNALPVKLLFIANLIEYGKNPKPTLFIHYKTYIPENKDIQIITSDYSHFYKNCINYNVDYISNL